MDKLAIADRHAGAIMDRVQDVKAIHRSDLASEILKAIDEALAQDFGQNRLAAAYTDAKFLAMCREIAVAYNR